MLFHETLDQIGDQFGVIQSYDMFDFAGFDPQFFQVAGQALPILLAFLPFREIQLGTQLLNPLERDRLAVLVIIFDDLLLMTRTFGHGGAFYGG